MFHSVNYVSVRILIPTLISKLIPIIRYSKVLVIDYNTVYEINLFG
jgi:hypothetical protein